MARNVRRLYKQFVPTHYDLNISISENKTSFTGKAVIRGRRIGQPSKRITLHQKALKVTSARIEHTDKKGNNSEIPVSRIMSQNSRDELRLHSGQTIYSGSYTLTLEFSGEITKNMEGVYPCFFKENDGEKQLVATQFESHHAREAFPCIDEPEAKATFQLTLVHDTQETALSNTPVNKTEESNGRTITSFEKTPVMSTYLLAFVVGELAYREARSKNNILIRTYATKDQIAHSDFALDIAVKCMDFYEDYYDIPFPLDKCDFVALPDFASGAMENWGLITFREQTLLCDEHTSLSTKQYVAIVVAHELTHQWFGNLVTMQWWTDLWLNEGFASWMEYLAIDAFFPEWQLWTQFAVDDQQHALKLDSLEHTHPIEVPIKHPDEIRTIFDAISYQKGASVIHMLNNFLGADDFRDGLRHYLKKHAYKNTHTVDLWQALEDVSKKPVKDFMSAWTSRSGFPLLEVTKRDDHLHIVQKRFVTNPSSKARHDDTTWPVPLLTDDMLDRDMIKARVSRVPFKESPPVKLNLGQTGFYRVDYGKELQQNQLQAVASSTLDPLDRMGLLADGFEVTKAGYQPIDEYLDLMNAYKHEHSLSVWEIIASSISTIRSVLSKNDTDDELREALKPFVQKLTQEQRDRLGWEPKDNEKHLDTLLRPIIIGLSAGADHTKTVSKALEKYNGYLDKGVKLNPDLRTTVYCTAARKGGKQEFDQLLALYKKTNSSDEKLSITAALTNFEDVDLHQKTLGLIKTDTVRLQDITYWIAYSLMNRHGRQATWNWIKQNWRWLTDNIGNDLGFSRMPMYIARTLADEQQLDEYKRFFSAHMEASLKRSFDQGIEVAETNVSWRKRDAELALQWVKAQLAQ